MTGLQSCGGSGGGVGVELGWSSVDTGRDLPEDCQRVARGLPEDCQGICQRIARGLPEGLPEDLLADFTNTLYMHCHLFSALVFAFLSHCRFQCFHSFAAVGV